MSFNLKNAAVFKLVQYYSQHYRGRLLLVVSLVTLASLSEAIGIASLLPLIALVIGNGASANGQGEPNDLGRLGDLFDTLGIGQNLYVLMLLLCCAIAIKVLLNLAALRAAGYTASFIARDYRKRLVVSLVRARWAYFTRHRSGELVNAMGGEPDRAARTFPVLVRFLSSTIQVVFYGLLALWSSVWVTISALIVGFLLFFLVRILTRLHRDACAAQASARNELSSELNDILISMKGLKAMRLDRHVEPVFSGKTESLSGLYRQEIMTKALLGSLYEPAFVIVLCVGLIVFTQIYPMEITVLMFMALLFQRLMAQTSQIFSNYQTVLGTHAVFNILENRIREIEGMAERRGGLPFNPDWDAISFQQLSMSYGETQVFRDFSLRIDRNTLTVIHGPSGSGKTTIIDLLVGLYEPQSGHIMVGSQDLHELDHETWRSAIGYVQQETLLFNDSIAMNVSMGDSSYQEQDIQKALALAGLDEFIQQHPDGIHAQVGERGVGLSGGQRQRVAIARALLRGPQLLILDEASSALDQKTARDIAATINELKKTVTIVAVTHQAELLDYADQLLEVTPLRD